MLADRRIRCMIVCYLLCFFILISNGRCAGLAYAQVQPQTNLTSEVNLPRGHQTARAEDHGAAPWKTATVGECIFSIEYK